MKTKRNTAQLVVKIGLPNDESEMECSTVSTIELEQVEGTVYRVTYIVYRISYTVYGSKGYCAAILATSDKCGDCGESL